MASSMPVRLYVNGRFLVQRQTGVQRFANEVVLALNAMLDEPGYADLRGRLTLVTPRGVTPPVGLTNFRQIAGGALGKGYAWEQVDLPRLSADGVLLNLCNLGPISKRQQVVVLHDASPWAVPQAFSRLFRSVYSVLIPAVARRANQLATVSEFSRSELARWVGIPKQRMAVCREGGEHILLKPGDPSVISRHKLAKNGYFLAVGMGPKNKNQRLLLEAFALAGLTDVQLVLTGRRNSAVHGAADLEIPPGVVHVGHVPDTELRALYEGALALIYPSSYEGFGLPPLEAMFCGCPVIMSDQPAVLEVVGDAGLVVAMGNTAKLAEALQRIDLDTGLRGRLSTLGRERARAFSWRATAERLLKQCQAAAA